MILYIPVDFLECSADHFNWEEFEEFVTNIEGRIKYHIPGQDSNKDFGTLMRQNYQTTVDSRSWLLFLRGARTGSPRSRLARMLPR